MSLTVKRANYQTFSYTIILVCLRTDDWLLELFHLAVCMLVKQSLEKMDEVVSVLWDSGLHHLLDCADRGSNSTPSTDKRVVSNVSRISQGADNIR